MHKKRMSEQPHPAHADRSRAGFTLIEILTVVAVIALLIAILLPSLRSARRQVRSSVCKANLKGLMTAIHTYAADHAGTVIPSYNMRGVTGGSSNPLDGWGPILDKGRYVMGARTIKGNPFACPDTVDVAGLAKTQTGSDPNNPKGYMDWPTILTISKNYAIPIPRRGYKKIIRVSYWINGDNPIGIPRNIEQGLHFTGSVGYGPDFDGNVIEPNRFDDFKSPFRLIALADGVYAGQQQAPRLGDVNSRIGYRHPGRLGKANVAFADAHVDAIEGDKFPRKMFSGASLDEIRSENLGSATVYADPEKILAP